LIEKRTENFSKAIIVIDDQYPRHDTFRRCTAKH
jgi:hypothetical protein